MHFTPEGITAIAIACVPIIVKLVEKWRSSRRALVEDEKTGAEADAVEAEASLKSAQAVAMYAAEIAAVRKELTDLRKEVDQRDAIIMDQRITLRDVSDWAERLVHQVKSLGAEPVPFRSAKGSTNSLK